MTRIALVASYVIMIMKTMHHLITLSGSQATGLRSLSNNVASYVAIKAIFISYACVVHISSLSVMVLVLHMYKLGVDQGFSLGG